MAFQRMLLLPWLLCLSGTLGSGSASLPPEGGNPFAKLGCCKRQTRYVYVGHDLSGSPVSVDVGVCRTHCMGSQHTKPHTSGLPELPRQSSMLDFIRSKRNRLSWSPAGSEPSGVGSERSCPLGYQCESSRVRVEELLLLNGPHEVEVIENCQCATHPYECLRSPALKTFFPDSPLERTVDVGKCSSPPRLEEGLFCVPTISDSVLLKSPNGNQAVRILERCELREACYRVSHLEYYFEIVISAAGEKQERIKEIDVGRCLGHCAAGSRCLLSRGPQSEAQCLLRAEGVPGRCVPQQYETHTFQSRMGTLRTVLAVQRCRCEV
ncbi:uncharacterized protein LOC121936903 isoform X2 [Sceloporus undulatus]|uniref:uncharacterized protein LOC121936903 isoform X2 n=1 Tax=Sceloporus undulatus TaxID=8520 RepID=UPI001C4B7E11|nr:uncharacterized protein LOC121936903 isoform X2 [Sceloporus undulatus]